MMPRDPWDGPFISVPLYISGKIELAEDSMEIRI